MKAKTFLLIMAIPTSTILAYYADRLAFQYRGQPNARATVELFAGEVVADQIVKQVGDAFNVDTASGEQLDIIGKYVGLPRNIGEPLDRPYYDFSDYDGTVRTNGFTDYTNAALNAQAIWYDYNFLYTQNTDLSDEGYRFMLKMKIVLNSNDGTLASIQDLLHTFLPDVVELVDNQDMTMTYTLAAAIPVAASTLQYYLPKPMGVGVNFIHLTAAASPATLSGTRTGTGSYTVTTSVSTTATPTNGVGPYTYTWNRVSSNTHGLLIGWTNSATTYFSATLGEDVTATGVFNCIVTDSLGLVAYTNTVAVTLINQTPP
jgi:hypothetical protein